MCTYAGRDVDNRLQGPVITARMSYAGSVVGEHPIPRVGAGDRRGIARTGDPLRIALVVVRSSDLGPNVLALMEVPGGDEGDHKGAPLPIIFASFKLYCLLSNCGNRQVVDATARVGISLVPKCERQKRPELASPIGPARQVLIDCVGYSSLIQQPAGFQVA